MPLPGWYLPPDRDVSTNVDLFRAPAGNPTGAFHAAHCAYGQTV